MVLRLVYRNLDYVVSDLVMFGSVTGSSAEKKSSGPKPNYRVNFVTPSDMAILHKHVYEVSLKYSKVSCICPKKNYIRMDIITMSYVYTILTIALVISVNIVISISIPYKNPAAINLLWSCNVQSIFLMCQISMTVHSYHFIRISFCSANSQ